MPHFDSTISLGNLVAVVVMLGTFYTMHQSNVKRVQQIEMRVNMMWSVFKKRFHISDAEDNKFINDQDS